MANESAVITHTVSGVHGPFTAKRFSWWFDFATGGGSGIATLEQLLENSTADWMTIYTTAVHMPVAETFDTLNLSLIKSRTYRVNVSINSGSIRTFIQPEPIE